MAGRARPMLPWIFLAALTVAHLSATLDRVALSLLVEPIKADLGLSDTQVSLLQGLAFVMGLVCALIPIGILVDRVIRTRLLATGVGFWSVMTACCGLAGNFWTLFLARMGVGVGEAGLLPASYSLIADMFERRRLGTALSIFTMGGAIGTGLSFIAGGALIGAVGQYGDAHIPLIGLLRPWQTTLILLALPGFVMAVIVYAIPHPPRRAPRMEPMAPGSANLLRRFYTDNWRLLARHHVALGGSSIVMLGAYSWIAPLFVRVHGWDSMSIGFATGSVVSVATPVGLLGGGFLGDYLTRYGAHMRLLVCAVSVACGAVCALTYPLLPDPGTAIILYGGMALFTALPHGVGNAALQAITPNEIRGRVSSIFYLTVTMVGVIGPTAIALLSDRLFPFQTGIRYATAIVLPTTLATACLLYLWALAPYRRVISRAAANDRY